MNFIGVDLHKKSITVCVMDEKRKVLARKTLACTQTDEILEFFRQFRPFKVVVEATASYVWFVELVEPLAEKVVLANPKKLRVIAESTKKTDRLDAQVLTEFLVLDMIPESYQPTPRQRQHRALVRHRQYLQGRITSVRSKIRHILSNYNADRKDLFSANCGPAYLKEVRLSDVDRFVIKQLWAEWQDHLAQRLAVSKKLKAFVAKAPQREAEAREILKTAPGVGPVTAEVVLSELGDISRFRNAKAVCAYAGLVPVVRQSGERKSKDMKITKEGSGLLRWALVEAAWRLVGNSPKWAALFARLMHRSGKKRAIVAVARKLLCVLYAMLRTSTPYKIVTTETTAPRTTGKESVRTSTPDQTTTTETTAPRTTGKESVRTSTPDQTTTTETTAPRTTGKESVRTSTPDQTTTTETTAPRTTGKESVRTSTPDQTQPRRRRLLGQLARSRSGHRLQTRPQPRRRRLLGQLARSRSGHRLRTRPQPRRPRLLGQLARSRSGHRLRTRPQPRRPRLLGQLARSWSGRRLRTRPQPRRPRLLGQLARSWSGRRLRTRP